MLDLSTDQKYDDREQQEWDVILIFFSDRSRTFVHVRILGDSIS